MARACGHANANAFRNGAASLRALLIVFLPWAAVAQLVGPGALVMGGGGRGGSASFGSHSYSIQGAPVGFFVDGSSIEAMNGVYGPRVRWLGWVGFARANSAKSCRDTRACHTDSPFRSFSYRLGERGGAEPHIAGVLRRGRERGGVQA